MEAGGVRYRGADGPVGGKGTKTGGKLTCESATPADGVKSHSDLGPPKKNRLKSAGLSESAVFMAARTGDKGFMTPIPIDAL